MLCKSCHYPLKQLTEPRCPECGRRFDPNDPSTYLVPADRRLRRRLKWLVLIALIYLGVFLLHLDEGLKAARPIKVVNSVPNATATLAPEPVSAKITRAASLAFFKSIFQVTIVLGLCTLMYWPCMHLISKVRTTLGPELSEAFRRFKE